MSGVVHTVLITEAEERLMRALWVAALGDSNAPQNVSVLGALAAAKIILERYNDKR